MIKKVIKSDKPQIGRGQLQLFPTVKQMEISSQQVPRYLAHVAGLTGHAYGFGSIEEPVYTIGERFTPSFWNKSSKMAWGLSPESPTLATNVVLYDDRDKSLVENERLKSLLIGVSRELNDISSIREDISGQHQTLLEAHKELVKSNAALQAAFIAKVTSQICLDEVHQGVVTDADDIEIEVTYDTGGGLKQTYEKSQFLTGKTPAVGDSLSAYVIIAVSSHQNESEKEQEFDSDLPNFGEKAVTGRIRI